MALVGEFSGKDLLVTWERNPLNNVPGLVFKDYEVEVIVDSVLLRTEFVTVPRYTYYFDDMIGDQGLNPSREVSIRVRERDTFNRTSAWVLATFANPIPETPTFSVDATFTTVTVDIVPVEDNDLVGYMVFRGDSDSFPANDLSRVYKGPDVQYIDAGLADNTDYFYKVAAYDLFDDTVANLNVSAALDATTLSTSLDVIEYSFQGVVFSTSVNTVSWTAGSVIVRNGASYVTKSIPADNAVWTTGTLYLYYDDDVEEILSTTDLTVALGTTDRRIVGSYKGGTNLVEGLNDPIIDGSKILAGTVGATQVVAAGLITNTAQINNGIIQSANIADAAITSAKIGDLEVDRIKIANGAVSDSAAFSVYPAGGLVMDDITDGFFWKNEVGAQLNLLGDKVAFGNGLFVRVGDEDVVGTSSDGISWVSRPLPSAFWNDVVFANGVFVAVGDLGVIITSSDGATWTVRTSGSTSGLGRIQYANSQFIVPAAGSMLISNDGITWSSMNVPITAVSIAYGAGRYVATSSSSVRSSPDGITWTTVTPAGVPSLNDVTFGNGVFVLVGNSGTSIFTSPDGITWTARTTPAGSWGRVKYTNNTLFAFDINVNDGIIKSSDGITWVAYGGTTGSRFSDIIVGSGRAVAVNQSPSFPATVYSDNLTTWTTVDNPAARDPATGRVVAYGGGVYVALDSNAVVNRSLRSTNGVQWTPITAPTTSITGLIFAAGLFVAVKSGVNGVWTSPDGITWTNRTTPNAAWTSIAYSGSIFVVVGDAGGVMTSPDGITWTSRTAASTNNWKAVTWGNSLFVAVSSSGVGNRVMTSPDGITWTSRTSASDSAWADVVFGSGLFVAVHTGGTMTSPTGTTWTSRSGGGGSNINHNGTLFVSARLDNVRTSPDGITWTTRSAPNNQVTSSPHQLAVGASNSFIMFDTFGKIITSPTGTVWQTQDTNFTNAYSSVVFGNGRFVAVSTDGLNQVLTSEDSVSWMIRSASQANSWTSVAFGVATFVAVSSDGTNRVMTSVDGITWVNRTAAQANSWRSVAFGSPSGSPLFVAVSSDGTNRVMTSPDGITWTARTAAAANSWRSVVWTGTQFVAVSSDGTSRVMTSPNGITWTSRTAAAAVEWQSVAANGSLIVAVSNTGTAAQRIMTSPDGITWTSRTAPIDNNWISITSGGGLFVAVAPNGTNRAMTSADGITWTSRNIPGDNGWSSVTFANGLFVAVSASGLSSTSIAVVDVETTQNIEFFDKVFYNVGTGIACPSRLIIEPGLYGSSSTFVINSPVVNGVYTARFVTGFTLYKYADTTYTGVPTVLAQRSQMSLEYEWRNQVLARSIGADQVESLVSPIIINKGVDFVDGNGLALALYYSSYSTSPTQAGIVRTTPGFGFIWSAFWK